MTYLKSMLYNGLPTLIGMMTVAGAAPASDATAADAAAATVAAMAVWDSGDPTPQEQYVLEMINRARKDPQAEGRRIGIDITESLPAGLPALVGPRPPLAMNPLLLAVARAHSKDMDQRNYFAHVDPDGKSPFQRIGDAGYSFSLAAENIAAGSRDQAGLEDQLMIDATVPSRGHRINLLSISNPPFNREIGIGSFVADQPNGMKFANFLTEDFGLAHDSKPFILGVVYHDDNQNGICDPGEGYPGVTVTPDDGSWKAVTGAAGAYAFPAEPGVRTITFDFGVHGTVVKTVTVGDDNVKVDALTTEARRVHKHPGPPHN